METRNRVSRSLTLSVALLLHYGNHFAVGNEGVCKLNQDVYVPSNDLSCQEDISDINSPAIERYRPPKEPCTSNFDTTGITQLIAVKYHRIKNSFLKVILIFY